MSSMESVIPTQFVYTTDDTSVVLQMECHADNMADGKAMKADDIA